MSFGLFIQYMLWKSAVAGIKPGPRNSDKNKTKSLSSRSSKSTGRGKHRNKEKKIEYDERKAMLEKCLALKVAK